MEKIKSEGNYELCWEHSKLELEMGTSTGHSDPKTPSLKHTASRLNFFFKLTYWLMCL